MGFFQSIIRELLDAGHMVDIAANENGGETPVPKNYKEWNCNVFPLSCERSPIRAGNISAIGEIKRIIEENHYDIVHCHTPIVAACTRLACRRLRRKGVKVLYTAHGFHFYSGAPVKNWLFFFPVEWICSFWTDILITINCEDYRRAKKRLHAKRVEYVAGVGINTNKFDGDNDGAAIRSELGISKDQFLLLSVGELNHNKNHEMVIKALRGIDNICYVIVGDGALTDYLRLVAYENGVDVRLTGFRSDVVCFYNAADAYILPSIREGLNVSLMEAMASGLPCLAGRIRGNTDLIDENGGITFNPMDISEIKNAIIEIQKDCLGMGNYNKQKIKSYDIEAINAIMQKLYEIN